MTLRHSGETRNPEKVTPDAGSVIPDSGPGLPRTGYGDRHDEKGVILSFPRRRESRKKRCLNRKLHLRIVSQV